MTTLGRITENSQFRRYLLSLLYVELFRSIASILARRLVVFGQAVPLAPERMAVIPNKAARTLDAVMRSRWTIAPRLPERRHRTARPLERVPIDPGHGVALKVAERGHGRRRPIEEAVLHSRHAVALRTLRWASGRCRRRCERVRLRSRTAVHYVLFVFAGAAGVIDECAHFKGSQGLPECPLSLDFVHGWRQK